MSLFFAVLSFLIFLVSLIFVFFLDRRYCASYRKRMKENVYHCLKCKSLYTSREKGESAACPVCGYRNGRMKF